MMNTTDFGTGPQTASPSFRCKDRARGYQVRRFVAGVLLWGGLISGSWVSSLAAASLPASAETTAIVFAGQVVDENGAPLRNFQVTLENGRVVDGHGGRFRFSETARAVMQLRYSAPGYYDMVQSFSPAELAAGKEGLEFPPVVLVRRQAGRMLMVFGGDAMMGRRYRTPFAGEEQILRPGHEVEAARAVLASVREYLELADFASVNLETALMDTPPRKKAGKAYTFYSPTAFLAALEGAGVDHVSLGNNHVYDYLDEGMASTLAALKKSSVGFSGGGRHETEALRAHREMIAGVMTHHLGFVGWKGNFTPHQAAEGKAKGGAAHGRAENIIRAVSPVAKDGEAVVVQYHGSREYSYRPSETTLERMRLAVDQGADLVIGHHPHVSQGFDLYKGKLLAYSLGNFVFDQYRYETFPSLLLYVWMDGEHFHRAEVVPLYLKNYRPTPAVGQVRRTVLRRLASLSGENGLIMGRSGGHGVILPQQPDSIPVTRLEVGVPSTGIIALAAAQSPERTGFSVPLIFPVRIDGEAGQRLPFLLGHNHMYFGDFEQQGLWGLEDRSWRDTGAGRFTQEQVHRGVWAYQLSGKGAQLEPRSFLRRMNFAEGARLSLVGYVYGQPGQRLSVKLKLWENGTSRARALRQPAGVVVGQVTLARSGWQPFALDFRLPDSRIRGFMPVVELDRGGMVYLDDLALVEWFGVDGEMTPEADSSERAPVAITRADYLRTEKPDNNITKLTILGRLLPLAAGK